jgi:predicted GIY-YIG superfamily endonuclease
LLKGVFVVMNLKDLIKISKVRNIKFSPVDLDKSDIGGGIYRMYDQADTVIYVGKSQDLHRRIHQHVGKDTHAAYFMDEVKLIEWTTEIDPVYQNMLEAIFIAYHRPKYNDEVKDAKKKLGESFDVQRMAY